MIFNKKDKFDWSLLFLGFVFLSAATYRVFNYQIAINEITNLNLPVFFVPFTIILEYVLALSFIFKKKLKQTILLAILFLAVAIILAFITHFQTLIANISELFTFRTNPTDVFLHMIYLGILIFLYYEYENKTN